VFGLGQHDEPLQFFEVHPLTITKPQEGHARRMTAASRVEVRLAPHGNKCMGRWRGSDRTGGGFIGPRAAPGQQVALATGDAGRSRHSLPSSGSAIAVHRPTWKHSRTPQNRRR
jgi:hypothetical protein